MTYLSFLSLLILSFAGINKDLKERKAGYPVVQRLGELESIAHNDTVNIEGYFRKYEATSDEKGGGLQYFNYEIVFTDDSKIPLKKEVKIDTEYVKKNISVLCIVSKSPIHDLPCPPHCQNTSRFWQIKNVISVLSSTGNPK